MKQTVLDRCRGAVGKFLEERDDFRYSSNYECPHSIGGSDI
jgi:hypothetical protein